MQNDKQINHLLLHEIEELFTHCQKDEDNIALNLLSKIHELNLLLFNKHVKSFDQISLFVKWIDMLNGVIEGNWIGSNGCKLASALCQTLSVLLEQEDGLLLKTINLEDSMKLLVSALCFCWNQ